MDQISILRRTVVTFLNKKTDLARKLFLKEFTEVTNAYKQVSVIHYYLTVLPVSSSHLVRLDRLFFALSVEKTRSTGQMIYLLSKHTKSNTEIL